MVQLKILSGKRAGTVWVARRFPVRIGRAPTADLVLEEDGVWDEHLEVLLQRTDGFVLRAHPDAPATVNGQPVKGAVLRNGDGIEFGSVKLQFWLSPTRQKAIAVREWLTWVGLAAVVLAQIGLIYWLLG